jgi:DNA gyrase inhibitor GyrI
MLQKPLEQLYTNIDAGLIVLMASQPLFERYLRQKSGVHETHSLTDSFYKEFLQIFPSVGKIDNAKEV